MTFRIEKAIELADCRQPPSHRGGRKTAPGQVLQVGPDVCRRGLGNRAFAGREMVRKVGKVALIGLKGVTAGAAFRRKHVEEQRGQGFVGRGSRRGHEGSRQRCFANLSGGTDTDISRCLGSYQWASATIPPYRSPPRMAVA